MSWLSRIIALTALFAFSACGFSPMYGAKSQQKLAAGFIIETASDAKGQQFKADLEDRLNPEGIPSHPTYKLNVSLGSVSYAMGVARDGTASRFNVILSSNYTLTRLADNKVVKVGNIQHVSSFNNQTNQYFSTYISEKDAVKRGITELSELYRQRIGTFLLAGVNA